MQSDQESNAELNSLSWGSYTVGGTYGIFLYGASGTSGSSFDSTKISLSCSSATFAVGAPISTSGDHSILVKKGPKGDNSGFELNHVYNKHGIGRDDERLMFSRYPYHSPPEITSDKKDSITTKATDIKSMSKPTYTVDGFDVNFKTDISLFINYTGTPFQITDYVLDVKDSKGVSLGKSSTLDSYGTEEFTLSNIPLDTQYNGAKIVAESVDGNTVYATSPAFDFGSSVGTITTVSTPTVESAGKEKATIKTTASSKGGFVGSMNEYYFKLFNSDNQQIGDKTGDFSDGGEKTLDFEVEPGNSYNGSILVAYDSSDDSELARSSGFDFSSALKVVDTLSIPTMDFYDNNIRFTTHVSDSSTS